MNVVIVSIGMALTAGLAQVNAAPRADLDRIPLQIVHIQHGGVFTFNHRVLSLEDLKERTKFQRIYVLADKGIPLADIGKAMDDLSKLPDHHVFLLGEDAKVAP